MFNGDDLANKIYTDYLINNAEIGKQMNIFQSLTGLEISDFNKLFLAGIIKIETTDKNISLYNIVKAAKGNILDMFIDNYQIMHIFIILSCQFI